MDAGGWALPARPAPGAGHRTRPVLEEVGATLSARAGALGVLLCGEYGLGRAAAGPEGPHDGPARLQTPPSGQRPAPPPSPGKIQFRTCGRTTHLGVYSHYQNKALVCRTVTGFRTQIPDSVQTLHIRERQDSEQVKCSFNCNKFSAIGCHLRFPMAVRRGLD